MKRITIKLDDNLHKAAKIKAIEQNIPFMKYVEELIRKDLATKEQSH